jgi:hypothetical protein
MVASPRHADAGRSVIAAPEQHRPGPAAADSKRRDEVSRRLESEGARKRAAPASGVAAEREEERRRRLWRSGEAAALYIVAALRRPASDKGSCPCTCRNEGLVR